MANKLTLTVVSGRGAGISRLLYNLMLDTGMPLLIQLAEKYGLRRMPGLDKRSLIQRIGRTLTVQQLEELEDSLINARFGALTVDDLLQVAVNQQNDGRAGSPRIDDMPAEEARLIERSSLYWVYTMHGYDVVIDRSRRILSCGCQYFRFAANRRALCKHLARALTLIPPAYAREALDAYLDQLEERANG